MDLTGLGSGTLYPLLIKFEKHGLLEGRWEDGDPSALGRPRRKLYSLTAQGVDVTQRVLGELSLPVQVLRPGLGAFVMPPDSWWGVFSNVLAWLMAGGVLAAAVKGHAVARFLIGRALRRIASEEADALREEWEAEIAAISRARAVRFAFGLWFSAGAVNVALKPTVTVGAGTTGRQTPGTRGQSSYSRSSYWLNAISVAISLSSITQWFTGRSPMGGPTHGLRPRRGSSPGLRTGPSKAQIASWQRWLARVKRMRSCHDGKGAGSRLVP